MSLGCPESRCHRSNMCGASDSRQAAGEGCQTGSWVPVLLSRGDVDTIWRVSGGDGLDIIVQRVKQKRRAREVPLVILTDFLRHGLEGVLFWVVTVDGMELRGRLIWLNVRNNL